MNLYHLARLPWSLLCVSFAFAAAAAPVAAQQKQTLLTPENFKQTIYSGVWLVEHFSPYCHHCREFAPTWDLLVADNEKASDPGIGLAQVDCAVHGDLCEENHVTGYPQINLYNDGVFVEYYRGRRDLHNLQEYIAKHAKPTVPNRTSLSPNSLDANPSGKVLSLDSQSFDSALRRGHLFVKFYAPWCGHCRRIAPTWAQLARHMQHKLAIAEVNCDENSYLCKSNDVLGYPTLIYFSDGSKYEYTGGRDIEQLISFTEKASAPPIQELVADDKLEAHLEENPVVYLFLHRSSNNHIVDELLQASKSLLGSPPLFSSASKELFSRYSLPTSCTWGILALKDRDSSHPTGKLLDTSLKSNSLVQESLNTWLLENRLPTTAELTQDTFQEIMKASHGPLVVIAAVTLASKDTVAAKFKDIGKVWRVMRGQGQGGTRDVVFAWMDMDRWGSWMKSMYNINSDTGIDPAIIVADHGRLVYYDTDKSGQSIQLTSASIFSAIDGISSGSIRPKNSENMVERFARYLNKKLSSLETILVAKFWKAVLVFSLLAAAIFLSFTRCNLRDRSHENTKSNRLD